MIRIHVLDVKHLVDHANAGAQVQRHVGNAVFLCEGAVDRMPVTAKQTIFGKYRIECICKSVGVEGRADAVYGVSRSVASHDDGNMLFVAATSGGLPASLAGFPGQVALAFAGVKK